MICGKQRIVVKTYKKYVSGSLTIVTKTACPDPLCQKKVNKKLFREDAARERIKNELEQESYAVDVAYDGEEGFDLASTEGYDVIILDLMLPKIDGLTVCLKLRGE